MRWWRREVGTHKAEVLSWTSTILVGFSLAFRGESSGRFALTTVGVLLVLAGIVATNLCYLAALDRARDLDPGQKNGAKD